MELKFELPDAEARPICLVRVIENHQCGLDDGGGAAAAAAAAGVDAAARCGARQRCNRKYSCLD